MNGRLTETVRDWGDYRDQRDRGWCTAGRRKEWETTRDSEGLGRLQRPRRPGEVLSRQRKEWETNGDSERLGRQTRPGEVHSREKKRVGDYKRQWETGETTETRGGAEQAEERVGD